MTIKKSTLKKAGAIFGGLLLISLFVLVAGPMVAVEAAEDTCGNGVCDLGTENNDLCPEDCQCIDNGVEDPGEGCGCKDVLCEGEAPESACGSPCEEGDTCGNGLRCEGGACWDATICAPLEPKPVVSHGSDDEEGGGGGGGGVCTLTMDAWTPTGGRDFRDIGTECFGPCNGGGFGRDYANNEYLCNSK